MSLETNPALQFSEQENSRTYVLNGHTAKAPYYLTFKRTVPKITPSDNGVAGFEVKLVLGDVDANGIPRKRKTYLTLSGDEPTDNNVALMSRALTVLTAILADASLIPNLRKGIRPNTDTV